MEKSPEGTTPITDEDLLTGPLAPAVVANPPGVMAVETNCPKCTGPMIKASVGHVAIYGWWLERETRGAVRTFRYYGFGEHRIWGPTGYAVDAFLASDYPDVAARALRQE